MRRTIKSNFFILLMLQIVLFSCNKETCSDLQKNQDEVDIDCGGACAPCAISYPENGAHGINILDPNTNSFSNAADYSLSATVPDGSSVLCEISAWRT
jgi:hypothetical protein